MPKKNYNQLIKQYPRHAKCTECGSIARYENPMARCDGCKKKFCYNHVWGGYYKKPDEEIKDVCAICKPKYKSILKK